MKIKCLQVGPIGTNCYLLCDEDAKTCAVIDPGGDGARIAAAVAETGCVPCAILLTHGHYDHTGAVGELQAKWPETPVYLNRRDVYADACTQQLFPLLSGDVRDYDEGDTVAVGGLTVTVLATPRPQRGVCHPPVPRRPLLRGYALCGLLRPDGLPRRVHGEDDGLSAAAGAAGGRPPGPARPHGGIHPGPGAALEPLSAPGHAVRRARP